MKRIIVIFIGIVVLLLGLVSIKYLIQTNKNIPINQDNNSTKVYLLLLDCADPDIIDYLILNKQMPNFEKIKEEGAFSRLKSFEVPTGENHSQILSLPVIGTIFTGMTPEEHQMVSHTYAPDGPDNFYAFKDMPVKSLWDIVNTFNKSVGIVGTLGNYPIDNIKGYIVSGEYIRKQVLHELPIVKSFDNRFLDKYLVYPDSLLIETKQKLPTHKEIENEFELNNFSYDFPEEIQDYYLNVFTKNLIHSKSEKTQLKILIDATKSNKTAYYVFSSNYVTMELSKYFYNKYVPDLFIEYLDGLDYFGVQYNMKEYINYSDMNNPLFRYYKLIDEHVGTIINSINNDSILMIISDHGVHNYTALSDFDLHNAKNEYGIFYLYGQNVKKNAILTNVSVYDITPTVLYLLGLPVGKNMEGVAIDRAMSDAYSQSNPVAFINSYDEKRNSLG